MEPIKDHIGKVKTPDAVNTQFMQLLNSLSGLRIISHLGNQQLNQEELINAMMHAIIGHLDAEEASLYLYEEDSLNCVAYLDWDDFRNNKYSINNKTHICSANDGILGKTATNKQVTYITNCKTSDENLIHYEKREKETGTLICAPMLVNDSLLGVIELIHPTPNHFDTWQEHSIIIYSDLMSMLLNNYKLMNNMQNIVDVRTEELRNSLEESEKLKARYEEMSVIDPLTKLYNRRYFYTEVTASMARAKRYTQPFSLMLMDLDHFKLVNDTYGHECGDNVLKAIAEILTEFTREGDTLARIGGEEFVLALPETDVEGAHKLAKRIISTIQESSWDCRGVNMEITMSIGISSLGHNGNELINDDDFQVSDILREADRALYFVKGHGRNNIKSYSDIPQ
jgi:diguanylate cyclase (GGDEF)-like protein